MRRTVKGLAPQIPRPLNRLPVDPGNRSNLAAKAKGHRHVMPLAIHRKTHIRIPAMQFADRRFHGLLPGCIHHRQSIRGSKQKTHTRCSAHSTQSQRPVLILGQHSRAPCSPLAYQVHLLALFQIGSPDPRRNRDRIAIRKVQHRTSCVRNLQPRHAIQKQCRVGLCKPRKLRRTWPRHAGRRSTMKTRDRQPTCR